MVLFILWFTINRLKYVHCIGVVQNFDGVSMKNDRVESYLIFLLPMMVKTHLELRLKPVLVPMQPTQQIQVKAVVIVVRRRRICELLSSCNRNQCLCQNKRRILHSTTQMLSGPNQKVKPKTYCIDF